MHTDDLVVITGAAQGIGLSVTKALLNRGIRVALLDIDGDGVDRASAEFRAAGGITYPFVLDVTDEAATRALADHIESHIGAVTGLVTCAGITQSGAAATMSLETFRRVIDINLIGTFLTCQQFAASMLKRGKGSIVTISSISGTGGQSGRTNYSASKWGVIGLTKSLAIEWGNRGIRVNSVAPGAVNTALFAKVPEGFRNDVILQRTPLKRLAEPGEVANAITFLLSDDASFINGSVLNVDGGFSAGYVTHKSGADIGT